MKAAVISHQPLRLSNDLLALAIKDTLESAGVSVDIGRSISDISKIDADIWFFLMHAAYCVKYMKHKGWGIPSGIKILMNCERLPESLPEGTIVDYPYVLTKISMRSPDVSEKYKQLSMHLRDIQRAIDEKTIDWIFEYSPHNDAYWKKVGIKSAFCPVGFHERFVFDPPPSEAPDIFCFARWTERREAMGSRLVDEGLNFEFCKDPYHRRKMGKSPVGLHIHATDRFSIFPERRMHFMASNGQAIVSEPCDWTPFENDEWIECEYEEIPDACRNALNDQDMGMRARERYEKYFRFSDHLLGALRVAGIL